MQLRAEELGSQLRREPASVFAFFVEPGQPALLRTPPARSETHFPEQVAEELLEQQAAVPVPCFLYPICGIRQMRSIKTPKEQILPVTCVISFETFNV
jgi:hypothetical protein